MTIDGRIAAALSAAGELGAAAGLPGLTRTNLQRHDLSVAGREMIQDRVEFDPGADGPRHWHPGEEIIYVLKGSLKYELEGQPPVIFEAGDVLFIPSGTVHAVKNVGSGGATELATYFVEKGKPLLVLAD